MNKSVIWIGFGLTAYWLLNNFRRNQVMNVVEQPEKLNNEEIRSFEVYLRDILGKNTLPLTVREMCQSLGNVFPIKPDNAGAFVSAFVVKWRGYLNRSSLPSGEIGYHWR